MKKFIVLLLAWYVQDLLQITMTQTFLPPELYALALIWCATYPDESDHSLRWLVAAVVGGLLTDLRWIGVPGLCMSLYGACVLASRTAWRQIPENNRRMEPFVVIASVLLILLTPVRLLFWDSSVVSGRVLTIVGVQWLLDAFALLLFALSRPYNHDEF